jgi:cephalosporin hydroxylase
MSENDAEFEARKRRDIAAMTADAAFQSVSHDWLVRSIRHRYSYNFRWLGLPIIQYPADIVAMQELIWRVRPRVVVETGVARGGSLVFYASMLELLGMDGFVLGVEVALSPENRAAIGRHALARRIRLVDGSSIAAETVGKVGEVVAGRDPVLVVLDSHHSHDHVLNELRLYSPLVRKGSYIVVFDTLVEDLPADAVGDRPWGVGDNPRTAVSAFLKENNRFEIDRSFDDRLLLSVCRGGFLSCLRDPAS